MHSLWKISDTRLRNSGGKLIITLNVASKYDIDVHTIVRKNYIKT